MDASKRHESAAERARARVRRCVCLNLRRLTRRITRHYDDRLRPAGVSSTQLPVLSVLQYRGGMPVGELANELDLERTSLARILRPLAGRGWLRIETGQDRRVRVVSLTEAGQAAVAAAEPLWEEAQREIEALFGPQRTERLVSRARSHLGLLRDTAP